MAALQVPLKPTLNPTALDMELSAPALRVTSKQSGTAANSFINEVMYYYRV